MWHDFPCVYKNRCPLCLPQTSLPVVVHHVWASRYWPQVLHGWEVRHRRPHRCRRCRHCGQLLVSPRPACARDYLFGHLKQEVAGAFFDDPNLDRERVELENDRYFCLLHVLHGPSPSSPVRIPKSEVLLQTQTTLKCERTWVSCRVYFLTTTRPCNTFRAWMIGIAWAILIPGLCLPCYLCTNPN